MEVEGCVPYLRTGPHAACPVTFGPGMAAKFAPPARPLAPSTAVDAVEAEQPSTAEEAAPERAEESRLPAPLPDAEGSLRKQASNVQHLMTHIPKNPYCEACLRAKARRSPAKRSKGAAPHREHVKDYGDEVSIDHIILGPSGGGETALVLKDLATGWIDAMPLPDKTAESTYTGLRQAFGRSPIGTVHSDGAPEIERALKDLDILAEDGTQVAQTAMHMLSRPLG